MPGIDLSLFKLDQVAFECKYDDAFLLWDRAGDIWSKISSIWPNLSSIDGKPDVQTFRRNNDLLSVQIDKLYYISHLPNSTLKAFILDAQLFFDIAKERLMVSSFKRLGFRLIYKLDFPDKDSVANTLLDLNIMHSPKGKHFNIEGRSLYPQYKIHWEGRSNGIRLTLAAQRNKIDFDAPPGIAELETVHTEKNQLTLDIDYFTLAPVRVGQLDLNKWLSSAYHVIKRDIESFFRK